MKNFEKQDIEYIVFAGLFQRRYHGLSALDFYLENLRKIHELLKVGRQVDASIYFGFGLPISNDELMGRRQKIGALLERGVQFIFPGHPDFPMSLLRIAEPPFLLSYVGRPVWKFLPGLAVVGSREPHPSSIQWMDLNLGLSLEKISFYVASGGARGIDQKAHALALAKGRPTVVFVPAGLGKLYPQNLSLFVEPILRSGGSLVSEYDFDEPMKKHYFHARNRLISGLTEATLIVQAARKSGTLITGRQAIEQARPVLIVPSHPLDVKFQGGLDLLMEGGTPVRDAADLCVLLESEFLSYLGKSKAPDSGHQNLEIYT